MTGAAILSVSETHRLDALEGVIERGKAAFVEVGEALLEIRDRRLYRESHGTFEAYCGERWGFTRVHAHYLVTAAKVVSAIEASPLSTTVNTVPSSERVARELAPVLREAPERVAETWQQAVDTYGPKPTAAQVRSIVRDEPAPTVVADEVREIGDAVDANHEAHIALLQVATTLTRALRELRTVTPDKIDRSVSAGVAPMRGRNGFEGHAEHLAQTVQWISDALDAIRAHATATTLRRVK